MKASFFTSLGYENTPELIGFILTVAYKASKVKLLFSRHCDTAASSTSYYTRVSAKIVVVTICTTYNCRPQHFFVGGTSFRKSSKRYVSRICVEKKVHLCHRLIQIQSSCDYFIGQWMQWTRNCPTLKLSMALPDDVSAFFFDSDTMYFCITTFHLKHSFCN